MSLFFFVIFVLGVMIGVQLARFAGVVVGVCAVAGRAMGVMGGILRVVAFVMLGRFAVMTGRTLVMIGGFGVMLDGGFFRHRLFLSLAGGSPVT